MKSCDFPGCSRPHHAKGWCMGHYQQLQKGRTLTPIVSVGIGGTCTFPDCYRPHHANGLCHAHSVQHYRGGPLMPLQTNKPKGGRRPRDYPAKRICRECGQHWRTEGSVLCRICTDIRKVAPRWRRL